MKAVVYDTYGSPEMLKLQDVEKPSAKDDEALVSAALCPPSSELQPSDLWRRRRKADD